MKFTEGRVGRVFIIRIDHGEDLLNELTAFAREKHVRHATVQVLGAIGSARVVTGAKEPVIPPDPNFEGIEGGYDLVGTGTIYPGATGPALHIHANLGRSRRTITGCIREHARVYLVVEAIVTEITGVSVERREEPSTGLNLPYIPPDGT